MKRMLITGISGLLGNNLGLYFQDKYDVLGLYHSNRIELENIRTAPADICSPNGELGRAVGEFRPDVVIHCASLTNIDFCESNRELTSRINIEGTRAVVESLRNLDCKLVYISTDTVYDGVKGNYMESDPVNPPNFYGLSKYEGELETLKKADALVIRTNIFGWNVINKYSIAEWIIAELASGREIKGFRDVIFSSIYNFDLARVLDQAIGKNLCGIYNLASSTSISKFDFAIDLAERFGLDRSLIKPVSVDDFPFTARRAKNLSLNTEKISAALGRRMPTIHESIDDFYSDHIAGLPQRLKRKRASYPVSADLPLLTYGRQVLDDDDVRAVTDVLKSINLTQGPHIAEFERDICGCVSASHGIACNSGTAALHMACLAAGVGPGDEVVTSPNTFVASANCALYCGARPVFADIDPRTYNISPAELEKKISTNTKAVIPVHFAGQSCDMEKIRDIVLRKEREFGKKIFIIEDACHALGSLYKNHRVGSCGFSDMAVLSFHPVKHITTGEGGMVLTNDGGLARQLRKLRSHGITSNPDEFTGNDMAWQDPDMIMQNPWYYEQQLLGYNYRITDIQCALGISQLHKLESFRRRRRQIVYSYNEAFRSKKNLQIPFEAADCDSNFHLYVLLIDFQSMGVNRARFIIDLKKKGIQTQVHYIPVHLQPYYRNTLETRRGDFPQTEAYYEKCLSIPLHPAMTDQDINRVIYEITQLVEV
jgi:UDP-4-amino-4,6-dideoxy-N-acetyl-beta-L-altrosamine transaminase/dTDP-4-dehydrorhamnose reductase